MIIYTSYFGNINKIPVETRIAVSRGIPDWYVGEQMIELAPDWKTLKMSREDYDETLIRKYKKLNWAEIFDRIMNVAENNNYNTAVLLCWEKPNTWCHRRLIAEILEEKFNIVVTELGYERHAILPYFDLPEKEIKKNKIKKEVEFTKSLW